MTAITARDKVAIGFLFTEYLIPLFVPIVKILTGEPHMDTGPSYPILTVMSVAMIVLWPFCLTAAAVAKERRWYYVAGTLLYPVYLILVQPLFRIGP